MEKSTLSIKETLSITFRTLKILFHAAPGGIAFLGILSTIAGVCPFLTLILSRAFLDSLARACGQQAFEMEIIGLLFFLFLTNMMLSVVNNLSILLKSDVSGRISLLVNAQVLEKCVHLPMSQYDNETTYNRIRFTSEQTSIRCTNLINTVFSIVQCLISFASVVCVLVSFNGIIVIASVVASIPLFFVNKYVSSFWYKISVGRVEKQRYSDVLRDLMLRNDNIKELKLFGSLSYLKSRILNQQTDFFREDQMNRKKFCKIDTAQKAANDFVILLLKLWIIILGIKQRATLGTINLYTSSLDQIQSAIFSFCTQLNTFYEQALYLESLFDLFDMQTEDENCGTPLTEPIRTIEFRHVYFSYPATNVYALKNVSFVLDDRHTYALIGLNGSGKTTLLKLLMKLYKPTLGTILINGQDIEEIDTAGLRKRISAIFQDFIKYPFTAEENITISDLENANDLHRLSKVIDDAGAAEVIDGLPHRLQTQLQKGWNRVLGRLRCAAGGDGAAAFACGGDRTAGDPLFPFPLDGRPDGLCPLPGGAGAAGRRPHPGRPGAQGVPKGNVLVCFGRRFSACARPARPATVAPALDHPRPVERLFLLGRLAARSGQSHRNRLFPEPLCQGCPRQMEHAGASHCRNARQCCGRKADAQQAAKKLHKFMKPIHLILRIIFVR